MIERKYFKSFPITVPLPPLVELQTESWDWLFNEGLKELFDEINPIVDFTGKALELEFASYSLDEPKCTEEVAVAKNLTFKAPLKAHVVLRNKINNTVKEADVFLGDIPLQTPRGTFIINGIERVVISQIVRSYGVLFTMEDNGGRNLFGAKIIPSRGAWLEFETSTRDIIAVKVDRKRKIPVTTFLRALGMEPEQILAAFSDTDTNSDHKYITTTLDRDLAKNRDEAMIEVYKRIRPGDLATAETARVFLENLFFNSKRYNLGKVGRYKINQRLNLDVKNVVENHVLTLEDVVAVIQEIIRLNNTPGAMPDDVDHLKNRRVRAVGELIQSRLRIGLLRVERIVKDRMSVLEAEEITPGQLINSRPVAAVLQEFFASSQLSQFMNQTNPLAEIEHMRCITATGPGGLARERAGFEVRDVHPSHYGRICPIETPEGPNIGLVSYLASYARVNEYGFIETPYLKVMSDNGKQPHVSHDIVYLDAGEEEKHIIAPASTEITASGEIVGESIIVRKFGEPDFEKVTRVDFMDVSARQTVSMTTALIPFVEHDDAARANMGSNMEKQAVPLIRPQTPVVGTGMEEAVQNAGQLILAQAPGLVTKVDGSSISVQEAKGDRVYKLHNFVRSNQATCINQRPSVHVGDKVKKGTVLADSYASEEGQLALGQNVLVAFMSYGGYNYEDAIIVSERLVRDDRFTSIHIEKYSVELRDTKLGPELLTRDIPNVSEEALSNLDDRGIVRIGAEISAGDILVGRISPKGETELSAEEKLLRAIFGDKAKDVKDSSLRLPHGERGKVVEVKIFSKQEGDELPASVYQMVEVSVAQMRKLSVGDKLAGRHGNKGVISVVLPEENMPYLADGRTIDIILNPLGVISRMNLGQILETHLGWAASELGYYVAAPVFDSVTYEEISSELKRAGLPEDGKVQLYDGKSGEPYDQKTTVGVNYILKLIHLVDDKMHARSTGPYSMVTQQPLGGKAQFGGQRFGEMEVWALEGYGAAHTLQEMLTIKSDDVVGRSRAYEAIIKGEEIQKPSIPASFYVLVRELQSLGLNIELIGDNGEVTMPQETVTRERKVLPTASEKDDEFLEDIEPTEVEESVAAPKEKPIEEPAIAREEV
jgi:DNA-directed RNA polymerase subunit beta